MRCRGLVKPRLPRQPQTAQVSQILAQRELAVEVNARNRLDGVILANHALSAIVELLFVAFGPPIEQVSVLVELAALVIEAVGQLVADGRTHVAVVGRVVFFAAEKRRLQIAGGKIHVVHLRVIVGVHGGRRHLPLALVHRLADLGQIARDLELVGAHLVAQSVAAHNRERRVVAPFIRVADLIHHRVQLLFGFDFGGGAHPVQPVEVLVHGLLNGQRHFQGALLFGRRKIARDVHLAQRLAQLLIHAGGAALPALLLSLSAVERVRVEVPVFLVEALWQTGPRIGVEQVPAQISSYLIDGRVGQERVELRKELWLHVIDFTNGWSVSSGYILGERKMR